MNVLSQPVPRSVDDRVRDIVDAIDKCSDYGRYFGHPDPVIRSMSEDAVLHLLTEIGEAVRGLPAALVSNIADGPRARALRNRIAHEYFGIDRALVLTVVRDRLPGLAGSSAERRLDSQQLSRGGDRPLVLDGELGLHGLA